MKERKRGKLYIFLGASGTGKDYMLKQFLNFGENNGVNISLVPRYFTRGCRKNEVNDEYHSYGNKITDVCTPDNFFAKINGEYVGINRQQIKNDLDSGKNLVLATGSTDLIEQIKEEFVDNFDDLCLIFVNASGLSVEYYIELEKTRNPNLNVETIFASANARWKQSELISNYYKENMQLFDYAYLNITKNAVHSISDKFSDVFFDKFFKVIIDGKNENGPNWFCSRGSNGNDEKDENGFER